MSNMSENPTVSNKKFNVSIRLEGEEATEFDRYCTFNKINRATAAKSLVIQGMMEKGLLPKWWERRAR